MQSTGSSRTLFDLVTIAKYKKEYDIRQRWGLRARRVWDAGKFEAEMSESALSIPVLS